MSDMSLEKMMKLVTTNIYRFQQETMGFQKQESQQPSSMSDMYLEKMMELVTTSTYRLQQETQRMIKRMENGMRESTSIMSQLISPICEELPSQTIIDLKEDESAIVLTSNIELSLEKKDLKMQLKRKLKCKK